MKKFLLFALILLQITFVFGQKDYIAPHYMTADELSRIDEIGKAFVETPPPTGSVRNIAEWEPMEGVLITYLDGSFGIPYSFIKEMSLDCKVTTIVLNLSEENTVKTLYTNNGVNLANCNFLYSAIDSWWSRDYSPWYIAIDNKEVAIVDFPYNRPRPNDDAIPIKMASMLGESVYGMDVINTGGNYMCDGLGVAAQTDLVLDEETQNEAQIKTKMLNYLGITNYYIRPDPLDDYIKHIDCWGKFIAVDKVMITKVPANDYRYADYEAAAAFFAETNCSYGYPYQVFRVQAAASTSSDVNPYSNSLILNNKVFVAQTGSQWDDEAIASYETAMPGYEIIGVMSNGWYNTDALHCRTYGIADRGMLYIQHNPLFGVVQPNEGFTISANINSYSETALANGFPKLHYSVNNAAYETIEMTGSAVKSDNYEAIIPHTFSNAEIKYYIEAKDANNKTVTSPLIGEAEPYVFTTPEIVNNIETFEINSDFNIYPNPSSGNFFLWFDLNENQNINVKIYSLTGQIIYNQIIDFEVGKNLKNIDITGIKAGIYQIKTEGNNFNLTKKLIIQ